MHGYQNNTLILENLLRVKEFIDVNFSLPLDLNMLAHQACMSPYHFLRTFKKFFYTTPHKYLTLKRIEKAKYLLKESELSVIEICFEVGFESIGTFSTLFHKYSGFPPAAYRTRIFRCINLGISIPKLFIPSCFSSNYKLVS